MLRSIGILVAITFIPALELRASIPWGMFKMQNQLSWVITVAVCSIANIVLGWLVFVALGPLFDWMKKWKWFSRNIWPLLERTQQKIHPYVEKYGEMGIAVFIGIPLPGSGVYSGAIGAYLLGLDGRKFFIANIIGVLIAAAAVTCLCILIYYGIVGQDSWMAKLFIKLS
ncbi:MAG: small multi-drug export protein [Desulfobacterota bacterium]|nr:small multi-drug export protein [Thermodesulfobacteriota bacterium]